MAELPDFKKSSVHLSEVELPDFKKSSVHLSEVELPDFKKSLVHLSEVELPDFFKSSVHIYSDIFIIFQQISMYQTSRIFENLKYCDILNS